MVNFSKVLDESTHQKLFERMPYGFVYFEMLYNYEKIPLDCVFLEVNKSFFAVTGLARENVLGKRITDVIPIIKKSKFDFIGTFGKVASTGESTVFVQYINPLDKWLEFSVFSDKQDYCGVAIHEVTNETYNSENLRLLNNSLIEYIKFPPSYINYKMITDDLLKLSGAKYTYISILNNEYNQATVESMSGEISHIQEASSIIGFNPIGSKWKIDEEYLQQIRSRKLLMKPLDNKVFTSRIPLQVASVLKKLFNFGEFWRRGLFYNEELLGCVFMIMPPGKTPANPELIDLFCQQLSIVLLRCRAEKELEQTKERLQFALEGSGDGVWDWNIQTNEEIFSDTYKKIVGYDKSDTWNSYYEWESRVHPNDLEIVLNEIKRYLAGEIPCYSSEHRLKCSNGSYKWTLTRGKITSWDDEGKPLRMVGTLKDISEKKQYEEELMNEKERAEKLSFSKSEYIANMSHELRTPLNVMLGAIQLFESYLKSDSIFSRDRVKKHLKSMSQNCFRLLRLVNNLIDTTKIDSGFYNINLQNNNIVNIVEEITLSVLDYTKQKGIELIFNTDVEERIVAFDIDMMERIMLNLLSNAIKFTKPNGLICVSIYDGDDYLTISVKDNGVGIPVDKQEVVFERYKQADRLLTREHEGSGIGLSLTKSIVEMHGGRIGVKSEVGVGSEFIIELPIKMLSGNIISQANTDYSYNNQRLIERMNIEFADIYK